LIGFKETDFTEKILIANEIVVRLLVRANKSHLDIEISLMEFLFRETHNSARTNRNIGDSIDAGGYINRVFKVCQRCMNFARKCYW